MRPRRTRSPGRPGRTAVGLTLAAGLAACGTSAHDATVTPPPAGTANPSGAAGTAASAGTAPSAGTSGAVRGGGAGTSASAGGGSPAGTGGSAAPGGGSPAVATPGPGRHPAPQSLVTLAFAGDVHFEGVDAERLAADPTTAIGPMSPVLARADLAMVNLETAVTGRGTPAAKEFVFRAPPTALTALRAAGIDVATEANNHGEDYGEVGLRDSVAAARSARFPVVGIGLDAAEAYAPYRRTIHGVRVAVLAATQVLDENLQAAWTAGPDKPGLASAKDVPRLLEAVRATRPDSDLVVVYLHWGTELHACPTDAQRTLAAQLSSAGADVVVGSHAHVLLGAGRLGSTYVDYGLGNFVFYADGGGPTGESGVLTLTTRGRRVVRQVWTPARLSDGAAAPLGPADSASALAAWQGRRSCTGLAPVP